MTQQTENKNGFLQNDRKLVCGMLVVYGLCIVGLVVATVWGLGRRNKEMATQATSTAVALVTRQAHAAVTAAAHATEQAQYQFINRFDVNNYSWRQGTEENKYWSGDISLEGGVYVWDVNETKDSFMSWADYSAFESLHDFDVYVDTKVMKGETGAVCSGFLFRKWQEASEEEEAYYYFSLCNDSFVKISYHSGNADWENIASLPYSSDPGEWNRLEVNARGSHFIFRINGNNIYEMDDDRQKAGGLALVIELNEKTPARIVFDNFGFQPR